jgi:hypothetical protein
MPEPLVRIERRTLQLEQEYGWALLDLGMIGFATLVAGADLDNDALRREFLAELEVFRRRVPFNRAIKVMEALTAIHPNRADIQPFLEALKEKLGHGG